MGKDIDTSPTVEVSYANTNDQHFQKVYCENCKKYSRAVQVCKTDVKTEKVKAKIDWVVFFVLLLFFVIPGIIYIVYKKNQKVPQTTSSSNNIQCCRFCGLPDYVTDIKPFNEGR